MNASEKTRTAGRPPKFKEERRPVTVTLPLRVLEILTTVDPDRARAIAKLADAAGSELRSRKPVEIIEVAPHCGLIVVRESAMLRNIKGLRLIELAPARFLITLNNNLSVESIEVQIQDMLEELSCNPQEIRLLRELLQHIRHQRRRKAVSKEELLIVNV